MNKRQKKKYNDRVRSLITKVRVLDQDGIVHTDVYPEATPVNAERFRQCWNWAAKNNLFDLSGELPECLPECLKYSITIAHRWNERPCAYWTAWRRENL